MSSQWQMILGGQAEFPVAALWCMKTGLKHALLRLFKTKYLQLKSSRLPPEMKSVQRAARAAGASGSGAQASGSEAGS